jgi:hypothetical protein
VGIALLGLLVWRSLAPSPSMEGAPASGVVATGEAPAPRPAPVGVSSPAGSAPPEAWELKGQLLEARARHSLGQAYERAAARGDFALAPGRILRSLLERRCGFVQRHAEELAAYRARLGLEGSDSASVCRELLFSLLKERLALPDDVSQARLWQLLEQVDAAYERLVLADPDASRDEAFRAAYARFQEARRGIAGPELDRRLFGLADDVLQLPFEVDKLARDSRASAEQKLATYEGTLQRIEREHGVQLASVIEPVELAKHALRLQETSGPLSPEQQRAVLERYAGPEAAARYLEHQREQEDQSERLRAFNQEREQLLEQLSRQGLTPEQRRQRMAELDPPLFEKYRLR